MIPVVDQDVVALDVQAALAADELGVGHLRAVRAAQRNRAVHQPVTLNDKRRVDLEAAVGDLGLVEAGRLCVDPGSDDLDVIQDNLHVGRGGLDTP